jgi:hypothetical protein
MILTVFHKWRSARYFWIISTVMILLPLICVLHSAAAAPSLATGQLDIGVVSKKEPFISLRPGLALNPQHLACCSTWGREVVKCVREF